MQEVNDSEITEEIKFKALPLRMILEDKTKIYWCFGSFPSDDNIKYLIISTCLGIIPSSLYIVFATIAVVPANKKGL